MQDRLLRSVRAAISLDASKMFNAILADKGLQKFILDMNKSQLFDGEDSIGVKLEKIGGGYSFTTEFLNVGRSFSFGGKTVNKKAGGSPILLDTGEYYDSYQLTLGPDLFVISSDPKKEDTNLEDDYGSNLEGLQEKNKNILREIVRNKLIEAIRRVLLS